MVVGTVSEQAHEELQAWYERHAGSLDADDLRECGDAPYELAQRQEDAVEVFDGGG